MGQLLIRGLDDRLIRCLKERAAVGPRLAVYDSLYVTRGKLRRIPRVSDDRRLLRRMAAEPTLAAAARPLADLP
jgi:predicted nucleic acid-binding protein